MDYSAPLTTRTERILSLPPMKLLLEPLETRFRFHFSGRRETNRIDKPEWMFTFVFTTVREHQQFLAQSVQPQLDTRGMSMDAVVCLPAVTFGTPTSYVHAYCT